MIYRISFCQCQSFLFSTWFLVNWGSCMVYEDFNICFVGLYIPVSVKKEQKHFFTPCLKDFNQESQICTSSPCFAVACSEVSIQFVVLLEIQTSMLSILEAMEDFIVLYRSFTLLLVRILRLKMKFSSGRSCFVIIALLFVMLWSLFSLLVSLWVKSLLGCSYRLVESFVKYDLSNCK